MYNIRDKIKLWGLSAFRDDIPDCTFPLDSAAARRWRLCQSEVSRQEF